MKMLEYIYKGVIYMITIYNSPSCTSCRKAKAWLEENNLEFHEKNIYHEPLTKEEIKAILILTDEGTEEIISYRSEAYQKLELEIESLKSN